VVALKEDIVAHEEEIRAEVEKLGERIIGVRIFYHLFPNLYDFAFNRNHYYFFRYPLSRPYSISVSARTR
jgi:predicted Holliday junction resolvase-like endonuclease